MESILKGSKLVDGFVVKTISEKIDDEILVYFNKSDCMKVYFFIRNVGKHGLIQWFVKINLHPIIFIKINQNFVIYFFRISSLQRIRLPTLSLLR